jgi:26S proteasome regulatory subunit N11
VVVDPIQSVKGKVVIDAFRLINPQTMMLGQEPRQTTSNLGHLNKPSIQVSSRKDSILAILLQFHLLTSFYALFFQALIHGLNRHYYSIAINYRKNELEEKMLLNLHKKKWTDGLTLKRFDTHSKTNEQTVQVSERNLKFCVYTGHLYDKGQMLVGFFFFLFLFNRDGWRIPDIASPFQPSMARPL